MLAYLQLWNLWLLIDGRSLGVPVLLATLGYIWHGRDVARIVQCGLARHWIVLLLAGAILLWTANRAIGPLVSYDAGLYYLSAIRWANTYPIVAGLGNLHGRLAYNSAYLLYVALLNVGPWAGRAYCLANSTLLVAFLLQVLVSLVTICRRRDKARRDPYHLFLALFLVPPIAFVMTVGYGVASIATDVPVFLLQAILSARLLYLLTRRASAREETFSLFVIVAFAVTGVLVKLSFVAIGGPAVVIAFTVFAVRWRGILKHSRSVVMVLGAVILATILPWAVRGVILSGYPVYPSTFAAFPVDWRVPVADARSDSESIVCWARFPGPACREALGNWHWLAPWFARNSPQFLLPLLIAAGIAVLTFFVASWRRRIVNVAWLFLVPMLVGLLGWFVTAPDPRFAGALFWLAAAGTIALNLAHLPRLAQLGGVALVCAAAVMQNTSWVGAALHPIPPGPVAGFYHMPVTWIAISTTGSVQLQRTVKRVVRAVTGHMWQADGARGWLPRASGACRMDPSCVDAPTWPALTRGRSAGATSACMRAPSGAIAAGPVGAPARRRRTRRSTGCTTRRRP